MKQGYGHPFVRVYNGNGDLVIEKVTRFEYFYSERVDDLSIITIEEEKPILVDHPDLQEGKKLILVFGYVGGKNMTRIVYIWDIKIEFTHEGVNIRLSTACKAAYLRLNSRKDVWANVTVAGMAEKMADDLGMGFINEMDGPKADEIFDSEWTKVESGGVNAVDKIITGYDNLGNPIYETSAARDATAVKREYFPLKEWSSFPQANASDKKTLQDAIKAEPQENITVQGRDDDLIISKRNFDQLPYKIYTWRGEPGRVLEFIPASKNNQLKKSSTSISVDGWSEETKEYVQGKVNSLHNSDTRLGEVFDLDLETIARQKIADPFDRPIETLGPVEYIDGIPDTQYEGDGVKKRKLNVSLANKKAWVHFTKRGAVPSNRVILNNSIVNTIPQDEVGRIQTKGAILVDVKDHISTVEDNPKDIGGIGGNKRNEDNLDLYESSLKVIGDPELVCSRIISILGVGKKYSGNYYVQSVRHVFTNTDGYTCELSLLKDGLGVIDGEVINKVTATKLGIRSNSLSRHSTEPSEFLIEVNRATD